MPSAQIISNLANFGKHLVGFREILSKPQFNNFQHVVFAMIGDNCKSCINIARNQNVNYSNILHFFNNSIFDDDKLLERSVCQMNNKTQTRTNTNCFQILDFTSSNKTGRKFEWADYLWNEESEKIDKFGYDSLVVLEYDPLKQFKKALAFRRFYHEKVLDEIDTSLLDFEKKTTGLVKNILDQSCNLSSAKEAIVDGEFLNNELVNIFCSKQLNFTGRIKKSLLVSYENFENMSLDALLKKLLETQNIKWVKTKYRHKKIYATTLNVKVCSYDSVLNLFDKFFGRQLELVYPKLLLKEAFRRLLVLLNKANSTIPSVIRIY